MRYSRTLIYVLGLLVIATSSAAAKPLNRQEQCAIDQAEASVAYAQCIGHARIDGIRERLSDGEVALLAMECEAVMLDQAEAQALDSDYPCDTTHFARESQDGSQLDSETRSKGVVKPQIPEYDFEWNGRFVGNPAKLADPQLVTTLTIRGKHQNGYFDVYMAQGGPKEALWVENLLHRGKLYSITHKWHTYIDPATEILGNCFENTAYNSADPANSLPITVQDLNGILDSSRFVSKEQIGGEPMNHFRATCLSTAGIPELPLFLWIPFKIFSDIYVPPGKAYPWYRWLQTGDGVGPDPQNDEWFIFETWNRNPEEIVLPKQCYKAISKKAQQTPCSNLIEKSIRSKALN